MRHSLKILVVLMAAMLAVCRVASAMETVKVRITNADGSVVEMEAELANTAHLRVTGLMGRYDFGPGDAMLFDHTREKRLVYWMKNTPISLDIIFFDGKGRWDSMVLGTTPFSKKQFRSREHAQYALEIAAGEARRLGIGEGSRLTYR